TTIVASNATAGAAFAFDATPPLGHCGRAFQASSPKLSRLGRSRPGHFFARCAAAEGTQPGGRPVQARGRSGKEEGSGGPSRKRTGVQGFAVLCVTTPPSGLVPSPCRAGRGAPSEWVRSAQRPFACCWRFEPLALPPWPTT